MSFAEMWGKLPNDKLNELPMADIVIIAYRIIAFFRTVAYRIFRTVAYRITTQAALQPNNHAILRSCDLRSLRRHSTTSQSSVKLGNECTHQRKLMVTRLSIQ